MKAMPKAGGSSSFSDVVVGTKHRAVSEERPGYTLQKWVEMRSRSQID
jgi:hypothetical protein